MRVFDHLDLRVNDVGRCRTFYDAFLREYGFRGKEMPDGSQLYYRLQDHAVHEVVVLNAEPDHRPNATRLGFFAASPEEVDRIAAIAERAGARAFEPPAPCPEYTEHYYAAFFEDLDGNKLEVVCRVPLG